MNQHVKETKTVLDVVEHPAGLDPVVGAEKPVYVQDDSDYPVDPLDLPDYSPAPGKAATKERQGVEKN